MPVPVNLYGGPPVQHPKQQQPQNAYQGVQFGNQPQQRNLWTNTRSNDLSQLGQAGNAAAQMGKDQAAFNAAGQLGVAGQNALGQYGIANQQALVNSQIAHANSLGQMGNSYYNMMGQLGQYGSGLGAAGAAAAADTNKAGLVAGALGGLGASAFGGGFNFTGPGGFGGSGSWGGGRADSGSGGAGGRPFSPMSPGGAINQGFGFLNNIRQDVQNRNSDANKIRGNIDSAFTTTQKNLMNPGIRSDMMSQMRMGYGALGGLYDKSDYGFNTMSPYISGQIYRQGMR